MRETISCLQKLSSLNKMAGYKDEWIHLKEFAAIFVKEGSFCRHKVVSLSCIWSLLELGTRRWKNSENKLQNFLAYLLTFTTASDNNFYNFFFFYFSEETNLDISCESSAKQTIHLKCQDLFSEKKKWKIKNFRMSSTTNFAWHYEKVYYFVLFIIYFSTMKCYFFSLYL